MTDQPRELYRFLIFLFFTLFMSYASMSLGIMVTALMNVKVSLIFKKFAKVWQPKNSGKKFTGRRPARWESKIKFKYQNQKIKAKSRDGTAGGCPANSGLNSLKKMFETN